MGRAPSDTPASFWNYVLLIAIFVVSAFPLYWMFVVGSGTNEELGKIPPNVVPQGRFGDNLDKVLNTQNAHFVASLINSLVVSIVVTVSVLFFCSLAGFAFAKLRFRGRTALLLLLIGTMTIPSQLGVVALYILMTKINFNQTLWAVIVPGLVTAFGVFYMRQFIEDAIPDEIIEAARVDGASTFGTYWYIIVPTLRPAAGVLGLLTFVQTWNDFQWPLITLQGGDTLTVQVALSNLATGVLIDYSIVLCGSVLATIPLLILFLVAGKQIVAGIMEGAVKA
ncbi:MAG: carbohydrate ABC transporter permease [Actinomycetales bacterium]|nr:carbohydrate ABC transporter permease [Actinomycetales bacterium]